MARLDGGWHRFPNRGDSYAEASHAYTPDLDVFGQGSLFQLLDETATRAGEQRLAAWLMAPAAADEVRRRQEAIIELVPELDYRQELAVACRQVSEQKPEPPAHAVAIPERAPHCQPSVSG